MHARQVAVIGVQRDNVINEFTMALQCSLSCFGSRVVLTRETQVNECYAFTSTKRLELMMGRRSKLRTLSVSFQNGCICLQSRSGFDLVNRDSSGVTICEDGLVQKVRPTILVFVSWLIAVDYHLTHAASVCFPLIYLMALFREVPYAWISLRES